MFDRDIDKFIVNEFMDLLGKKEIILNLNPEQDNELKISYSKKALKWIKSVKKKDPFWNEEKFIVKILELSIQYAEKNNITIQDLIQKEEKNDIKTEQTTDNSVPN